MNPPDIDLESDGREQPDRRDFTDRSAARGACQNLRAVPKDYIGFQGGNRRRRCIAALYNSWLIRIQSGRGDRIDCRGASVSLGSNVSTLQQTMAAMSAAEASVRI